VIIAVLVMIRLGFWQMDRWHEENLKKDQIEAGLAAQPEPLEDLLGTLNADSGEVPEDIRHQRVSASGEWLTDSEVLIRNHSQNGAPGGWLVTPLQIDENTAVAVVRGWLPLAVAIEGRPFQGAEPPTGDVLISGSVGLSQTESRFGPEDPANGELEEMARIDIERYEQQLGVDLAPIWLTLDGMTPVQEGDLLLPVGTELPSPTTNFSYMMQWFFFAAIFGGGYILILRKVALSKTAAKAPSEDHS